MVKVDDGVLLLLLYKKQLLGGCQDRKETEEEKCDQVVRACTWLVIEQV